MAAASAELKSAERTMNSSQQCQRPSHGCFLMRKNGMKEYKSVLASFCLALVWLCELGHPFSISRVEISSCVPLITVGNNAAVHVCGQGLRLSMYSTSYR